MSSCRYKLSRSCCASGVDRISTGESDHVLLRPSVPSSTKVLLLCPSVYRISNFATNEWSTQFDPCLFECASAVDICSAVTTTAVMISSMYESSTHISFYIHRHSIRTELKECQLISKPEIFRVIATEHQVSGRCCAS